MRLGILFWFYEHLDVCEDRIALLRALNPGVPVYGLFGGSLDSVPEVRRRFQGIVDDLWCYPEERSPQWKWRNGDLLITSWYRNRGRELKFDTLVVCQWDMLLLKPVDRLFDMLAPDQILLSGLRPITEVAAWWPWVTDHRAEYEAFLLHIRKGWGHKIEPRCCLFIVACLPRAFLEPFAVVSEPALGFLEYKIPMYAQCFGVSACMSHPYKPWWKRDPSTRGVPAREKLLNAVGQIPELCTVLSEVAAGRGGIVHPYAEVFPLQLTSPKHALEALERLPELRDPRTVD